MKKFLAWLVIIMVAVFILGSMILIGTGYYLSPQDEPQQADVIVVVSGGQTTSRAEKGIELFKQGYAPKLILSGAALILYKPTSLILNYKSPL